MSIYAKMLKGIWMSRFTDSVLFEGTLFKLLIFGGTRDDLQIDIPSLKSILAVFYHSLDIYIITSWETVIFNTCFYYMHLWGIMLFASVEFLNPHVSPGWC